MSGYSLRTRVRGGKARRTFEELALEFDDALLLGDDGGVQ